MDASILLSPLVELVLDNLNSLIKEEIRVVWGVEKDLRKLLTTLSMINDVLKDAEEKQVNERSLNTWLRELQDASYEADDILDEWATEALRRKEDAGSESRNSLVSKFLSPCFCFNKVVFRRSIGRKIKDIRERLDDLAKEKSNFNLNVGVSRERVEIRETGSFVDESTVIGREADKEKIVELLLSGESSRGDDNTVVPIVGIGGLGKTALAQLVYNDDRIRNHFELRMWVCVSEDFDVKSLVKRIIESATEKMSESLDLALLQRRLHQAIGVKRYLLVLDDVWNEDREKWDRLRNLLRVDGGGSRIIVTTRSKRVTSIMGTTPFIELEGLSEEDSWSLFKQRAFGTGNEVANPNLVTIGKEIVRKSKGVPLAVKALGGLMQLKRSESEWLHVKESEIWDLPEDENSILNALRLSYKHLPLHLKQCFRYCSLFPKDYRIEKEKLICLWIAEGFIQPTKGSKQMEDIGSEYFDDLVWRSFFQDVGKDEYGDIISCKMHDLMNDLAQSICKDECSIIEVGKSTNIYNRVLRSSIVYCENTVSPNILDVLCESKNLRTLYLIGAPFSSYEHNLINHFSRLRVLDLSGCPIEVLPDSIGNLKHLRYLSLCGSRIESLPESICTLRNLQTLDITICGNLSRLPKDMRNMINLRHLDISHVSNFDCTPVGIGKLSCLLTLPIFIVGNESGCGIGELKDLINLRGNLRIKKLENVRNMEEAMEAKLKSKQHLRRLGLFWSIGRNVDARLQQVEQGVLEGLQPHTNLKELYIGGCGGAMLPSWLIDSSVTNLESLEIRKMRNLEEWSRNGIGEIPCLRELVIENCPKLRTLPRRLPSLNKLALFGCDALTSLGGGEGFRHLTALKQLAITYCDFMGNTLEHLPATIEGLRIYHCRNLTSTEGLQNLTGLQHLEISDCPNLTSLMEGLQKPTALRRLNIVCCPMLTLPKTMHHLTALESLTLSGFDNMICLPDWIGDLSTLRTLSIYDCPKLGSLPVGLQRLTALESLTLSGFDKMTCLPDWIGDLSTLRTLSINDCPKLGSLPVGLQRLTRLDLLRINNCNSLQLQREDFPNIQHIQLYQ